MIAQRTIRRLAAAFTALAICAMLAACQAGQVNPSAPAGQDKRLQAMRALGTQASMTVFPVALSVAHDGKSVGELGRDVAGVLGVLLEEAGMRNLEPTDSVFVLPAGAHFDKAGELFGAFVRANPIHTDYALYAEILGQGGGRPQIDEVRSVVVDRKGDCVWVDRQRADDGDFKRHKPGDLMTACVLVAQRVRTQLNIPKSAKNNSGEGKFHRMSAEKSPGPGKEERAAMEDRRATLKKAGPGASLAVFPVRLSDDEAGTEDAAHLTKLLNEKHLCAAEVVASPLRVRIQAHYNEQRRLWDLARAFQAHLRRNPPEAEYALLADYVIPPGGERAWAVHFVVCDRQGDWVIVDFQNEHHGDFQSIDPKSRDDCGRLVAKRLEAYLR